jgi:alpha-D-ribose 1-methylphosphonate 5-triphosphate synthase subunit PhnH|nr:phosphonate C-P lyase system protein PhnH [Natronomonas sp. LN261]
MDPVYDTRDCFRALVAAMSRPGTVSESPTEPADHAVLSTLVDHEVTCFTPDETVWSALETEGRLSEADVAAASIVHAPDPSECPVRDLERGSLKEPSDGATVVYRVETLITDPDPTDDVTRLALSGPGVPGKRWLGVDGFSRDNARALADAQSSYPCGVDAVLTTDRSIAAIPRSTELEVA